MGKTSSALIGAAVGIVAGFVVNYLFGAANDTTFDKNYQSRLDKALEEGRLAAEEHEAELRRQLAQAKRLSGDV